MCRFPAKDRLEIYHHSSLYSTTNPIILLRVVQFNLPHNSFHTLRGRKQTLHVLQSNRVIVDVNKHRSMSDFSTIFAGNLVLFFY